MDEHTLNTLLAGHEADRVEFTVSTKDTDKFAEAVCAFANDLPGHGKPGLLVIGVDNRGQQPPRDGAQVEVEVLLACGGVGGGEGGSRRGSLVEQQAQLAAGRCARRVGDQA
jgi:ATP-dependent DNA helicase RecG